MNIIDQLEEPQKGSGPNFQISVGEAKAGRTRVLFDSNLVGGILKKTMKPPEVFLEISLNSQENACTKSAFFNKLY